MKHIITVFLLLVLGYFTWREWPRTMKVYSARVERIPMAYWKTADYDAPQSSGKTCFANFTVARVTGTNISFEGFGQNFNFANCTN